jgi:two-component system, sensor histidine kinase and response regulator
LVVDDHSVNQLLASKLLQMLGLDVQVVADGAQALQAVQAGQFDVVLMDIQMPQMDGWQATRHIRQWEQAQHALRTPIIALTAHASAADREQAMACGMDGYLTKPVTTEALEAALDRAGLRQAVPSTVERSPQPPTAPGAAEPEPGLTPVSASPLASRQRMLARVAGDEALLHSMATAFCADLRERMGLVHAAVQKHDWPTIAAQGHALRGAFLTMTAQAAANEAKALELAAQTQDKAGTKAAFAKLSAAAKVAYDAVRTW